MRSSFLGSRGFGSGFNEARGNVKSFDLLSESDGALSEALDVDDAGAAEVELDESLEESSPSALPSPPPPSLQPHEAAAAASKSPPVTCAPAAASSGVSSVAMSASVRMAARAQQGADDDGLPVMAGSSGWVAEEGTPRMTAVAPESGCRPSRAAIAPVAHLHSKGAAGAAPAVIAPAPALLHLRAHSAATRDVETQTAALGDGSAHTAWGVAPPPAGWPGAGHPPLPWMWPSSWPITTRVTASVPPYGPHTGAFLPIAVPLSASHPLSSPSVHSTASAMPEARVVGMLVGAPLR